MSIKNTIKNIFKIFNNEISEIKFLISTKADIDHHHNDQYGSSWSIYRGGVTELTSGNSTVIWQYDESSDETRPIFIAVNCYFISPNADMVNIVSTKDIALIPIIYVGSDSIGTYLTPTIHHYSGYGTFEFSVDTGNPMAVNCRCFIEDTCEYTPVVEVIELLPITLSYGINLHPLDI